MPECYQCGEPPGTFRRGETWVCLECFRHAVPIPPADLHACCICQLHGDDLHSAGPRRLSSWPRLQLFYHRECRVRMDSSWPAYAATWQTTPQAIEEARQRRAEAKADEGKHRHRPQ
jgi:hypothetical protein